MLKHTSSSDSKDWIMDETIRSYENRFDDLKAHLAMPISRHYKPMLKFREYIGKSTSNSLVLDVGCGIGEESVFLSKLGFKVVGIDASNKMIDVANYRNKKCGGNASFVLMDVRSLSFKEGTFDGIWCSSFIHHLPPARFESIILRLREILSEDGIIFICTRNFYSFRHLVRMILHCCSHSARKSHSRFGEFMINGRYYNCYKPSNLINQLNELGFDVLSVERLLQVGRFHVYARVAKE